MVGFSVFEHPKSTSSLCSGRVASLEITNVTRIRKIEIVFRGCYLLDTFLNKYIYALWVEKYQSLKRKSVIFEKDFTKKSLIFTPKSISSLTFRAERISPNSLYVFIVLNFFIGSYQWC